VARFRPTPIVVLPAHPPLGFRLRIRPRLRVEIAAFWQAPKGLRE